MCAPRICMLLGTLDLARSVMASVTVVRVVMVRCSARQSQLELGEPDDEAFQAVAQPHLARQPGIRLALGVHGEHLFLHGTRTADLVDPSVLDDDRKSVV